MKNKHALNFREPRDSVLIKVRISFIIWAIMAICGISIICSACTDGPSDPCDWYMTKYRVDLHAYNGYYVESVVQEDADDGKIIVTVTLNK